MPTIPRKIAERGLFKPVWSAYNNVVDYLQSLTVTQFRGGRFRHTANGTQLAVESTQTQETSLFQWRGEWNANLTYKEGDVVIRGGDNAAYGVPQADLNLLLYAGGRAGVYIALQDVPINKEPKQPQSGDPANYWETLARFSTHIFTVVVGTAGADNAGIILDARDPNGAVNVKLSECKGKVLKAKEIGVCVGGLQKKMMVIGSEPY